MNGFSKAFLVGAGVIGLGLAQPVFPQFKDPDSKFGMINLKTIYRQMFANSKTAFFKSTNGRYFLMANAFDKIRGVETESMVMDVDVKGYGAYTVSVIHAKVNGTGIGFIVTATDPRWTGLMTVTMGNYGKVNYSSGDGRKQAEERYAVSINLAVTRFEDIRNSGILSDSSTLGQNDSTLDQKEIDKIYRIIRAERENCIPILNRYRKENGIAPQKFEIPKKGAEPLYNSSNYRESKNSILAAMKANERRVRNVAKQPFIRNRLQAKA